tara:strand:- start:692 stop:973 length:282 start_codon:yes stop_codon:yes gene_type:complete
MRSKQSRKSQRRSQRKSQRRSQRRSQRKSQRKSQRRNNKRGGGCTQAEYALVSGIDIPSSEYVETDLHINNALAKVVEPDCSNNNSIVNHPGL